MVKQVRDLPETDALATMGQKLREARDCLGYSRAKVASETGIPAKTLEKIEAGESEPSVSRLKLMCDLYGLNTVEIAGLSISEPQSGNSGNSGSGEMPEEVPGELLEAQKTAIGKTPRAMDAMLNDDYDIIQATNDMLDEFGNLRSQGLGENDRKLPAIVDAASAMMAHLTDEELGVLAVQRGLHIIALSDDDLAYMEDDEEAAQEGRAELVARLIDASLIGVDLYSIDREALVSLADDLREKYDISRPCMFGMSWGDHEDMAPVIREPLRQMALNGESIDFENLELYPRQEQEEAA